MLHYNRYLRRTFYYIDEIDNNDKIIRYLFCGEYPYILSILGQLEQNGQISRAQKRDEYLRFCNMLNRILVIENLSESIKLIQIDDEDRTETTHLDQDERYDEPDYADAKTLSSLIKEDIDQWYDRSDMYAAELSGSGKTLAFAIPILSHMSKLIENNEMSYGQFTSLILTPTRELAVQIKSHIQTACRYTKFKTAVVVGGMSTQKQERLLSQKPEIIVATPGRFWELLQENNEHIIDMSNLRFLAIDETDRMIEKGHFEELEKILNLINKDDNNQIRQKFVFSATLMLQSSIDNEKKKQKNKKKKEDNQDKLATLISAVGMSAKPKIIDLTKEFGTAETLTEARVNCSLEDKDLYLYYFLTLYPGRTLIFTNSIDCIKRLQSILAILKRNPLPLHAQMEQKQRLTNLEKFSNSDNGLLVATDVAARGLDIPNIKHIIHYQVPRSTELYIHRSGRTARAEREGLSVMFICPEELFLYRKIIKTLNRNEDLQTFPIDITYLSNLKRRVRLASEISKLHHQVAKVANETNWYHKAAKELDIELDDNIRDIEKAKTANTKDIQKKEIQLRNELDLLLKQPLKYSSSLNISRSYPLLFGDPDQLASRRKNDMTALDELKHRS
ncbi:unnamed protein product [Rotaria sp. Silwood1]|nr:unnamed protein product [Rotaria sp. Silwood1]